MTVAGSPGSGGDEGSQEPAERVRGTVRPPPLSRSPLCPGLVCEVGMTIVATFQPTSQGCCGDTVISDCQCCDAPGARPLFLPSDRTCSSCPPCALCLCFSLAAVSSSLLRQGAVLTPASPVRLDSLTSVLPPFHLSQLQVWERLPGPSRPAWVFQPFQPPDTPSPRPPPRSDQFLSLPSPQAQ